MVEKRVWRSVAYAPLAVCSGLCASPTRKPDDTIWYLSGAPCRRLKNWCSLAAAFHPMSPAQLPFTRDTVGYLQRRRTRRMRGERGVKFACRQGESVNALALLAWQYGKNKDWVGCQVREGADASFGVPMPQTAVESFEGFRRDVVRGTHHGLGSGPCTRG